MGLGDSPILSPAFLALLRRAWKEPLHPRDLSEADLPEGCGAQEVWEALVALRHAQAFRSSRGACAASPVASDWHTVTERLSRTLADIDRLTRRGSRLDELAQARDSRAFITQQYVEEAVCNLRFDGYAVGYEDVRAVLRGERPPVTDGERIAVNFHSLMRELPSLADRLPLDQAALEGFYAQLLAGVEDRTSRAHGRGPEGLVPRSPLEEHYAESFAPEQVSRASLQTPIDVAHGGGSDPRRHPIMESMLVNCQFWRAPLFPLCNNLMGCVASRYYLVRKGYPVFRYVPKIMILEKWKHGGYQGVAAFSYEETLERVESDRDWTFYYDTVMGLMLREVRAMERALLQRAALDDVELDLAEHVPYLSYRQREVLRRAILAQGAEFTIAAQRERYGVVYSTARADLEDLVDRGFLDRARKGRAFVYRAAAGLRDNLRAL
ncbi:hypothetical protein HLV37_00540 [Eggerthellaceae bacterium zg-1084]|uniref:hypothetical protein n=1 Tax=Berryella wangjianweii TaxID=2734634 RepID=UPI001554DE7B|nr:hypothetical protein [Berryella wangjianweii]NPD30378.1 hypothetical protein [Berryella wangjianweii]